MKNVLKLCLILALCLSVLLVAGCKSEEKKTDEPAKNPETTGTTENGGAQGDETTGDVEKNPEGDPFDTDVGAEDDPVEGPDPTEPPVGIDDNQGGEEDDFDFEIDFGEDLAG